MQLIKRKRLVLLRGGAFGDSRLFGTTEEPTAKEVKENL